MTETRWLNETDIFLFLEYAAALSDRKSRLFALACYWTLRAYHVFPESAELARVVQRFIDTNATMEELERASTCLQRAIDESPVPGWVCDSWEYRVYHYWPDKVALWAAKTPVDTFAAAEAVIFLGAAPNTRPVQDREKQNRALVLIARDIFGNPFRPLVVDSSWLSWNQGAVVKLAQAIYEDRSCHELPILADVLERAGCKDELILSHCRGPGPHVRGCWVIDLLLGKP